MPSIPPIRSVMTDCPQTIDAGVSLRQARKQMLDQDIRHLPVTRSGKLVGVLTDRDLKRILDPALGLPKKDELFVEDAMIHDPYCVEPDEPLDDVLEDMADGQMGSALIVEREKLVGIFTATDACRCFAAHLRGSG